jgi:RNA polymerase sigma-70 factor (ECF subfamily)
LLDAVSLDGKESLLSDDRILPEADDVTPLVRAAQSGRRDAFAVLYERFAGYVYAILIVRVSAQEAADLVQDVFLRALERLGSLRDPRAFAGWLAAIARNTATDLRRRPLMTDELPDTPSTALDPHVRLDARRALDAIRRLPEAYRETLSLRFVQGMTGPEIARITGLTPESVRVNLSRGFKLLRAELGLEP